MTYVLLAGRAALPRPNHRRCTDESYLYKYYGKRDYQAYPVSVGRYVWTEDPILRTNGAYIAVLDA